LNGVWPVDRPAMEPAPAAHTYMAMNARQAQQRAAETRLHRLLTTCPFDDAAWVDAMSKDIHVRIGNAAPAIGRDAAITALSRFFGRVESVATDFWEACRRRETIFAEVDIRFVDEEGADHRIPCVVVARMAGSSLLDLRLGLDPSSIPPGPRSS
jgi:hypothetical protein